MTISLTNGPKRASLEAFALTLVSIALWRCPLAATLNLALTSEAHTHILLIPALTIALIYFKARGICSVSESRAWLGAILLIMALALRTLMARKIFELPSGDRVSLSMFALVIWCIGSVMLCMGFRTFRALLLPLCFLVLVVPFPDSLLSRITEILQYQSADAASAIFHFAGVPVTHVGVVLSIPGLDIEVARECSSIRSTMMLIVTTIIMADLFLRAWWRKTLLMAVAIPLSVAKNALRIFTIAELGTRVDSGFLDGRLHHNGGIVFFSLAVFVQVILLWLLRRGEFSDSSGSEQAPGRPTAVSNAKPAQ